MKRLALALLALALLRADMYPDASNAKLPEARTNLLYTPAGCDGFIATDAAMTAGSAVLTATTSNRFVPDDIGKKVSVRKAGSRFYAGSPVAISNGGAGHGVGDLVNFPDGVSVFVMAVTAGAVTKVYEVGRGSSATAPATISQTDSVKSGSLVSPVTPGGTGLVLAPTWVRENLVSTITSVSDAGHATLANPAANAVSGAVWGYGTDYGPQIQTALDAGEPVQLPLGICGHAQTLLPGEGDVLVGSSYTKTTLMWLGAPNSPQVQVGQQVGLRVTAAESGNYNLDGLGSASKGLVLRSSSGGTFWSTSIVGHTTVALDAHGSNTNDSIKNWFQRVDITEFGSNYSDADSNAHGIWWGFPNTFDTTADHDLSQYGQIFTKTSPLSPGLICAATDHNTVNHIQTRGGTTGGVQPAIEMFGGNWAALGSCISNHFFSMDAGVGGLLVRSTGWAKRAENLVDFYDRTNGGYDFTVEPGISKLIIRNSDGANDGLRLRGRPDFALTMAPSAGMLQYQTNSSIRNPGAAIAGGGTTGVPIFYDGTTWRVAAAIRPRASLNTAWENPTGTASTGYVMAGLGAAATITPAVSGNVAVTIWGYMTNSALSGVGRARLKYGTGTAPVNGVAETGTSACSNGPVTGFIAALAGEAVPFSMTCVIKNMTLDTPYWLDAAFNSNVGTNTVSLVSVTVQATEQ